MRALDWIFNHWVLLVGLALLAVWLWPVDDNDDAYGDSAEIG